MHPRLPVLHFPTGEEAAAHLTDMVSDVKRKVAVRGQILAPSHEKVTLLPSPRA